MSDWQTLDFFTDASLVRDPYPYYDELRSQCPVLPLPNLGVVAVSGYDEATEVYRNSDTFSSCNSVVGPFAVFPVPLEGNVSEIIDTYRDQLPMHEHMVTMDPPMHTQERGVLMRLITPKRLKENEEFIWRLADTQLEEFLANGECEFIRAYAQPFAMLVVADLLGVPEADHDTFRRGFGLAASPGSMGSMGSGDGADLNALSWCDEWFTRYIEDRRREPKGDVLTDLALATYPDGTTPEVINVVRTASFLFAAGQETTARLLAAALMYLAENPEVQTDLRAHPDRIPAFIEETLRIESPVKADFRMARVDTTIGGVEVAAGTPVMLLNGAANRDPRQFSCPADIDIDRANLRSHIAFGRGVHSCPGGPLARVEAKASLERILARTNDIRISEEHHGPAGARRFSYEPTWVLRGLTALHLQFTPVPD
ncbi:MAG TPA: cytochrome P450 [Mycobacteriales bacterium]|nr:cytochrome P450 [Mycobacteriales bacterium]